MDGEIERHTYAELSDAVRREIAVLQESAYGTSDADVGDAPLHDPTLNARSFLLRVDGQLVSYAGVVTTTVAVDGLAFTASGLSCVATDPDALRRGYASRIVAAATDWIDASGVDLGVFTCVPALAALYSGAGGWVVEPDVVVIGSRDPDALTSTALGVVVLMRLISSRAIDYGECLRHGAIDLRLPVGQFW